jgi:hypothetical protein
MNQHSGKQAFDQAQNFFKDANVQAFTETSMAASRDFYDKAATVAHETSKVVAHLTDTAWGSAKILNDTVILRGFFASDVRSTSLLYSSASPCLT